MSEKTFPQFVGLPLELRLQIWHNSLPSKDSPALFFYKPGCWRHYIPQEGQIGYYDYAPKTEWIWFFEADLDRTQVHTPLTHVNREARQATMQWAHELGIDSRPSLGGSKAILTRQMDKQNDVLYLSKDTLKAHVYGPWDSFPKRNTPSPGYAFDHDVWHYAVTEQDLLDDLSEGSIGFLSALSECSDHLEAIYIIVGVPEGLKLGYGDNNVQHRRWELDMDRSRGYVWDAKAHAFRWETVEQVGSDAVRKSIEALGEDICKEWKPYSGGWIREFEIRVTHLRL